MRRFVGIGLSLVALGFSHSGFADKLSYYFEQTQLPRFSLRPLTLESGVYQQVLDHNSNDDHRFNQRYYIDESEADSLDAPVFYYICGEGACSYRVLYGEIRQYAKKYHARLVALEHRYYGLSQPFKRLSTKNLRFLNTEQALNDFAAFERHLIEQRGWTGKWVSFGGSYPGSLSAYYRLKYPELVVGALASSAPVKAKEDFYEYDKHIAEVTGKQCLANIQKAVARVEAVLDDETRLAEVKKQLHASDIKHKLDVLVFMAEVAAASVQYGERETFCDYLQSSDTPLQGYAKAAEHILSSWQIHARDLVAEGAESEEVDDYADGLGMRQWMYQSCTEYGYWQNANRDVAHSARSQLMNAAYHRSVCRRLFGIEYGANTDKINHNYYQPLQLSSTRDILFTNGSDDPWSKLSLAKGNGNTTNPYLSYYTIAGAAHCDDLRLAKATDSSALKGARARLRQLLDKWLAVPSERRA